MRGYDPDHNNVSNKATREIVPHMLELSHNAPKHGKNGKILDAESSPSEAQHCKKPMASVGYRKIRRRHAPFERTTC